jgi:hypothetical protein
MFFRIRYQPTSSRPLEKKAISMAVFSSLSEPWTALRPLLSAYSLRTAPSAGWNGLQGPGYAGSDRGRDQWVPRLR